ncbi:Rho GTPase [Cytospora paraplurivora]|uniref:Rho GTPase n=1 Tax=Cytospora paraplurivora TaxID=2898453 RepID=A0AAN9YBE5_9PEZI
MSQDVMKDSLSPGFQSTRHMESFTGPWPTPPMRRLLRTQRRLEGLLIPGPLPSQKPRSQFIQTAAPGSSTRLPSSCDKQAENADAASRYDKRHRLARMDPARMSRTIIGAACVALMSTVGRTVADVTNFIRRCRSARADLAAVTRELSELQMVLELLNDYGQVGEGDDERKAVPVELQAHLRPILTNCTTVVLRIDGILRRHGEGDGPPTWTLDGRKEVDGLQNSLEVHRGALGLISDLISIIIARAVGNENFGGPQGQQLQLHEVIRGLQGVLSSILVSDSNATLARQHFALQVHLGQIIAYAQRLNKPDRIDTTNAREDAVRSIDARQGASYSGASDTAPEPVSPIGSIRGSHSHDGDGADDNLDALDTAFEPVSPIDSGETVSAERQWDTDSHASHSRDPRIVPRLTVGGLSPNIPRAPSKDHYSVSPMTYREPTTIEPRVDSLCVAEQEYDSISPLSLGEPISIEGGEGTSATTGAPPEGLQGIASDKGLIPGAPNDEDEEITEEALAFAQVPVHIMGRLSLNLVGHVYTNTSCCLTGESEGTSFDRSHSTIATAEDTLDDVEEAEGYAHSTSSSDTGSLRDGHLQFSQMDVTQVPTQESHPDINYHVQQKSTGSQQQLNKNDHSAANENVKVSVDDEAVDLSLWDVRGIDYDPSWLYDAQVALVCFSINIGSTDAKGKHLERWVREVNRNCPTAAILLIGLKSDVRWQAKTVEKLRKHGKNLVTPEQGEQLRDSIGALRYLECSARTGEGVMEVLEETTRIALQVRNEDHKRGHRRPLSRIGKFLGLGNRENDSQAGWQ